VPRWNISGNGERGIADGNTETSNQPDHRDSRVVGWIKSEG
jgi:hypothetical protein